MRGAEVHAVSGSSGQMSQGRRKDYTGPGDSGPAGGSLGIPIVLVGWAGPSLRNLNVLFVLFSCLVVSCAAEPSKANEAQIFILSPWNLECYCHSMAVMNSLFFDIVSACPLSVSFLTISPAYERLFILFCFYVLFLSRCGDRSVAPSTT